jgi:hypothetical protein
LVNRSLSFIGGLNMEKYHFLDGDNKEEYHIPFHGIITEEKIMEAISFNDPVNHPKHYTSHPSGVECIQITEHMNFCLGNAIKYIWRAGEKDHAKEIEDLQKARWYISREIERRQNDQG